MTSLPAGPCKMLQVQVLGDKRTFKQSAPDQKNIFFSYDDDDDDDDDDYEDYEE